MWAATTTQTLLTAKGDIHVRVFRKNGSTYSQVGTDLVLAGQTIGLAEANYVVSGTLPQATFGTGTRLYFDVWLKGSSATNRGEVLVAQGLGYTSVVTPRAATIVDRTAAYGVRRQLRRLHLLRRRCLGSFGGSARRHGTGSRHGGALASDGWAADEDASGQLIAWLSGIGQMFQSIDNLSHDGFDDDGNPAPGWSQLLDINRCPTRYLPWLAQFLGVRLNTNLRDDQQRYAIANPQGFGRGTATAIIAAVNQYLSPGFTATLIERDTSAYHLSIKVPTAGIAGLSTCESVYLTYTTCSALAAAYSTCAGLWKIPGEITAAVMSAIPAGLQTSITYD